MILDKQTKHNKVLVLSRTAVSVKVPEISILQHAHTLRVEKGGGGGGGGREGERERGWGVGSENTNSSVTLLVCESPPW